MIKFTWGLASGGIFFPPNFDVKGILKLFQQQPVYYLKKNKKTPKPRTEKTNNTKVGEIIELNESLGHLWDGIILLGTFIYNIHAATPPQHTCKE